MIDAEDGEYEVSIDDFPTDPVAARCEAFVRLVALTAQLQDEDLRKEAMMMLGAVRRSFRTLPAGDVVTLASK